MKTISDYFEILTNLKTDKAHNFGVSVRNGQAPHKPLLLLSVIDEFARGSIEQNLIEINDELNKTFLLYWHQIMGNKRTSISYPFFYLGNEEAKFWHLELLPAKSISDLNDREIGRSLNKLRSIVKGASLSDELYRFLQVSNNRNLLREVIIRHYFPNNVQLYLIEQAFEPQPNDLIVSRTESIIQRLLRDSKKAKEIKRLYDYTCQMCGFRMITALGPYAEAAHIKPLGVPHNGPDISENILCLCPNHHSLFDLGGVIINNDYSLIGVNGSLKINNHQINQEYLHYHRKLWR